MSTVIYYFSATGNSLTTARKLAAALGDCTLVPAVAAGRQLAVEESAEAVGFVFPVYYGDMPYPMRNLISRMVFKPGAYIFAVATCRGHAGAAYHRMDQLLRTRGMKLSYGESVKMPGNSFINAPEVDAEYLRLQDDRVREVASALFAQEAMDFASSEIYPLAPVAYPNNFRGIAAEDTCIGCGICAALCPMENISLAEGRARIGQACATCLACFHWCPAEAIWMSRQENIARRAKYHHPEVALEDIRAQK